VSYCSSTAQAFCKKFAEGVGPQYFLSAEIYRSLYISAATPSAISAEI
jgi:hypothetical protein